MADSFLLNALRLIRSVEALSVQEQRLLDTLIGAADAGIYWDTLSRWNAIDPNFELMVQNIAGKARFAGLAPELEKLRDAQVAAV